MKNVEHIGIAVKNIESSALLFEKLLHTACYKKEFVEAENVITAFFKTGSTKIELLQDGQVSGIISKFIEKHGEGIHHIAFEVENIQDEMTRLKKEGFIFLNDIPKKGADNKVICFLHPKSANGILIELCQQIKDVEEL